MALVVLPMAETTRNVFSVPVSSSTRSRFRTPSASFTEAPPNLNILIAFQIGFYAPGIQLHHVPVPKHPGTPPLVKVDGRVIPVQYFPAYPAGTFLLGVP